MRIPYIIRRNERWPLRYLVFASNYSISVGACRVQLSISFSPLFSLQLRTTAANPVMLAFSFSFHMPRDTWKFWKKKTKKCINIESIVEERRSGIEIRFALALRTTNRIGFYSFIILMSSTKIKWHIIHKTLVTRFENDKRINGDRNCTAFVCRASRERRRNGNVSISFSFARERRRRRERERVRQETLYTR